MTELYVTGPYRGPRLGVSFLPYSISAERCSCDRGAYFRAKATASDNSYKAYEALDKDLSTRWDTGKPARPGQWFEVDIGMEVEFEGVVLDTTGIGYL